jgi:hypothetical protein
MSGNLYRQVKPIAESVCATVIPTWRMRRNALKGLVLLRENVKNELGATKLRK